LLNGYKNNEFFEASKEVEVSIDENIVDLEFRENYLSISTDRSFKTCVIFNCIEYPILSEMLKSNSELFDRSFLQENAKSQYGYVENLFYDTVLGWITKNITQV
jgi:hypothetical protein